MSSTTSNPKEWLILQCQACGSPMRVRAQAVTGTRVSCPACHSPVVVNPAGGGHFPEFRVNIPQSSPEMTEAVRRRLAGDGPQDAEFTPTMGNRPPSEEEMPATRPAVPGDEFLQSLKPLEEPEEEMEGGKRVRKRRKKVSESRSGGLTDWNTVPLEELPEAELMADTWTTPMGLPEEAVREQQENTVVSESVEDGQTKRRVKRVRRRAIFGFAQLFFRRLSYGVRVTTVIISSIIGIGGMTYAVITLRQKFKPLDFPDVVEGQRPNKKFLTSQEDAAAQDAVAAFLKAEGMERKLPFVRLPNRVGPLMAAWYREHPDKAVEPGEVLERGKMHMDDIFFVKLRMEVKEPDPLDAARVKKTERDFVVEIVEKDDTRSYKVDWETAVEWRPMSFDEFRRRQPRDPVPFRVNIQGSGYYNHAFLDEKRWLACQINYPRPDGPVEPLFYGYIDRRSKAWEDLAIYTEPGNRGSVIVALRYPENAVSFEQVIVDSLVHPSWFYTKDAPPEGTKPEGK